MQKLLKQLIVILLVIVAGWGLNSPAFAQTGTAADPAAFDVFRNAYNSRYTWDNKFPGYTATVEIKEKQEVYQAQTRINPDLSIELTGIENPKFQATVSDQLRMLITHRRTLPFKIAHKEHTFTFGKTSTNETIEIDQHGKGSPSYYQLKDGKIIQVNRIMGPVAVRVDLLDWQDTPAGYLGKRYRAAFHYVQTGDELEQIEYQDTYKKVGDYYIPTHQTIRHFQAGQETTTDINFTDIKLLS
ncbi:DUF3386 domain-containing protein [Ancylothrix sp. C2]|uniref:DUF3386 domain-containing protein n=1 Tax=Ancylothrix sp. D3o TaxID=2953691 RepID=UPI0021BA8808|nr:DUF3386 domain-containing protein [Ancylothrix sp. D3o]MCT7951188.1 DUF3386 domain-containing protein [Ancylothrix sp. D3o]